MARYLSHTHTHIALVMLFFLSSFAGNAQSGNFNIVSIQNLPNGYTECIIDWNNNTISTAAGLNINITVSGVPICVDATLTIVDSYFSDPANGFTVTKSNSGVSVSKVPNVNNPISLNSDYAPFLTLLYLSESGGTSMVTATGIVVEMGFSGVPITPASASLATPNGFNLFGQVKKALSSFPGFQQCAGSMGGEIPNVSVAVAPIGATCYPSTSYPTIQLFSPPPYQFYDAPPNYSYAITPSKSNAPPPTRYMGVLRSRF